MRKAILLIAWGFYFLFLMKVIVFKYIVVFGWGTLIDHLKTVDSESIRISLRSANYAPGTTIVNYLTSNLSRGIVISNLVGNVALFIPYGILIASLMNKSVWALLSIGALTSLLFECMQLFLLFGSFDIDDLLLNSFGTLLGILMIKGWKRLTIRENLIDHSR